MKKAPPSAAPAPRPSDEEMLQAIDKMTLLEFLRFRKSVMLLLRRKEQG